MKNSIYDCDSCGRNMQHENLVMNALELENIHIGAKSTCVWDMYMEPLIDGKLYFCGFVCLKNWLNTQEDLKNQEEDNGKL